MKGARPDVLVIQGTRQGNPVYYYRLYFLAGPQQRISRVEEFEAPSDAEAMAVAQALRGDAHAELWCLERRVTRWLGVPPAPLAAAAA